MNYDDIKIHKYNSIPKKEKYIKLQGYFVKYNKYNRAKFMFLDDYNYVYCDDTTTTGFNQPSLTKKYITIYNKPENSGKAPVSPDHKYFYVKCKHGQSGTMTTIQYKTLHDGSDVINNVDSKSNAEINVPISKLLLHTVSCTVVKKKYYFKVNNEYKKGWNLQMKTIKLLDY